MDKPTVKRRPALVISNRSFNAANDHAIMAMITTAKLDRWPGDYALTKPADAGLLADCYVRWKVFTLPNSLIARIIGELADEDREALMIQARTIFVRA
ncbi:MAG: type II toxin-antitoxin system PemK/MazF family toxin [Hyphomicrobiales bacterium]